MNKERVQGKWAQFMGRVRSKWGKVTHDDVALIAGRREQLNGRLLELYGISKEKAEKELARLEKRPPARRPRAKARARSSRTEAVHGRNRR